MLAQLRTRGWLSRVYMYLVCLCADIRVILLLCSRRRVLAFYLSKDRQDDQILGAITRTIAKLVGPDSVGTFFDQVVFAPAGLGIDPAAPQKGTKKP